MGDYKHIVFISYDGAYPELCKGVLHLVINGIDWYFGDEDQLELIGIKEGDGSGQRFWKSGGSVSDGIIVKGKWKVDFDLLPDYLKFYADEIAEVMNEYIEYGCCGGCL